MTEPPISPPGQRFWQTQRENFQILFLAVLLAVAIRVFIAEPRYIPSDSMLPTLETGDRLVVEKVSYRLHPPHRQDVIVFEPPPQLVRFGYDRHQAFIKRIIGMPGDEIAVQQGQVLINGNPVTEGYILDPPAYEFGPFEVPEGKLLVMGDNRNNSNDSHIWGFLPEENIIGRAWFRFWPFNRLGWL
jgi:signal peptidase I